MKHEEMNTDALTWQLNLSSVLEVVSFFVMIVLYFYSGIDKLYYTFFK